MPAVGGAGDTGTHPATGLDETVHQRHRLGILTIASRTRQADFGYLRETLGLTSGNLSTHLTVLEDAGLIRVEKGYAGRRPRTWVSITRQGRAALAARWTRWRGWSASTARSRTPIQQEATVSEAAEHAGAGDRDPAGLLAEMRAIGDRTSAAARGYWLPLLLFGLLFGRPLPFYEVLRRSGPHLRPWPGCRAEACLPLGS